MKILFYVTYPILDASSRYRIYQYIEPLEKEGFSCTVDSLFPACFYKIKNKEGLRFVLLKILFLILFLLKRILTLPKVSQYDVIYVHREIFPFFTPLIEFIAKFFCKKMIFDFDDAIFLAPKRWSNWRDILRKPSNVGKVCEISNIVITGNEYLADYARKYNNSVYVLPTVYNPKNDFINSKIKEDDRVVIGWIGSWSTLINLDIIKDPISRLSKELDFTLNIIGSSNIFSYKIPGFNKIVYIPWKLEEEEFQISQFDIGIMPLFDEEWERGKCGFKLIQYMSLGVPVVASPVGINKVLVSDGINGYLASDSEAWYKYLKILLIESALRKKLGDNARKFINEKYSFTYNITKLKEILKSK